MALRRGLILTKERQFDKLIVQMDSQVVAGFLDSDQPYPTAHSHLIKFCKTIIREPHWQVRVQHIYREANACADYLANRGVTQEQQIWVFEESEMPDQLFRLMQQDVGGVSWPRFIPFYAF